RRRKERRGSPAPAGEARAPAGKVPAAPGVAGRGLRQERDRRRARGQVHGRAGDVHGDQVSAVGGRGRRGSPWALGPALLRRVRAAQVLSHWLVPTPYGLRLAAASPGALPRALLLAVTELLLVLVLFRLLAHAAGPRASRAVLVAYAAFASVELVYGQVDLALTRWPAHPPDP